MAENESTKVEEYTEIDPAEALGFDPENLIGDTLAGRYEIEQRIGKGGMGVVYLASQRALNRKVVVKVLAGNLDDDEEAATRFEREALGLSQLQHPNIVTIYDFGRDRDMAFIVMEYVEGDTISHYLRRHGFMPFDEFATIAAQILDALSEAHSQGIIHRDIKPSNIMLCERHGHSNFVKVLDFGLAKLINDTAEVTKKQNLVGSVAFLAPEQILGLDFDQRVDVYALGVLFYYMLTGQKPFRGEDDMSVLYQHIHKDPTPLREVLPAGQLVPEEIQALIHRCLSKDPRHRPTDAREFLTLLKSDVSRSVFAMPWSTGEFAALNPSSISNPSLRALASTPTTPSHQITPVSGMMPIPSSTDISGQYMGLSHSQLSNPYIQAPPQSNKGVIVGAVVAIAVIAAAAVAFVSSQTPKGESPEQRQARLEKTLENVKGSIDNKRWGKAQAMLDSVQSEINAHPELVGRAAGYRDNIEIGKLLHDGGLAEQSKDYKKARAVYQKVLARDATHEEASKRLAALPAEKTVAATGTVKIDSNTKARVSIDGKFIGYTPTQAPLEPGAHKVVVEANGYKTLSKDVIITTGATEIVDASLVSVKSKATPRWRPSRRSSRKSTRKSSNAGSSTPKTTSSAKPPKKKKKKEGLFLPVEKKKPAGGLLPI